MGSFTDYMEQKILDTLFGNIAYTPPDPIYVGLSSTPINEDGTGITEPVGMGYARVPLDNNLTTWNSATAGTLTESVKSNAINIDFPEATDIWGIMTHFFIAEDPSGGNIIGYGELNEPREIVAQDMARFVEGTLLIELD